MIALGVYFCFADAVLITQCAYYDIKAARKPTESEDVEEDGENRPLLRRLSDGIENGGPPGSGRRGSFKRTASDGVETLPNIREERTRLRACANNTLALLGVCAIGTIGWTIAYSTGGWKPTPEGGKDEVQILGAELLGYASAVCYLWLVPAMDPSKDCG